MLDSYYFIRLFLSINRTEKKSAMTFQEKMYYLCYNKKIIYHVSEKQCLLYKIKYKQ